MPGTGSKAKEESLSAVVWRDPGDVSTLNLLYGAGGKEHAPDPNGKFTFVKEDLDGSSPKFSVQDEKGVQWKVKLGEETQSETAATRMLWAAGYFVDEDYYLARPQGRGTAQTAVAVKTRCLPTAQSSASDWSAMRGTSRSSGIGIGFITSAVPQRN